MRWLLVCLMLIFWGGGVLAEEPTDGIRAIVASPTDGSVIYARDDGKIMTTDGRLLRQIPAYEQVEGLGFSQDLQLLIWTSEGRLLNGDKAITLPGAQARVLNAAALSPDRRRLAAVTALVSIVDIQSGAQVITEETTDWESTVLAWSPDGGLLAFIKGPHGLLVDSKTGKRVGKLQKDAVFEIHQAKFDSQGRLWTLDKHSLRCWDPKSGKALDEVTGLAFDRGLDFDFSERGQAYVTGTFRGEAVGRYWPDFSERQNTQQVCVLGFGMDGLYWATVGDQKVGIFQPDGQLFREFSLGGPIAWPLLPILTNYATELCAVVVTNDIPRQAVRVGSSDGAPGATPP